MKPIRLAFLIAGAIALIQSPAISTDINFGGVTIPSQQTLSPAGHEDIAFRPACTQLVPIQRGNTVFWTVTLSDGNQRVLQHFPPLSQKEAFFELDAYGLCKIGGVEVPLVYTSQVPQRQVAQVTTSPTMPAGEGMQNVGTVTPETANAGPNWLSYAIGAPILLIVAALFVQMVRGGDNRKSQRQSVMPKPKQGNDNESALTDIFGGGRDA